MFLQSSRLLTASDVGGGKGRERRGEERRVRKVTREEIDRQRKVGEGWRERRRKLDL